MSGWAKRFGHAVFRAGAVRGAAVVAFVAVASTGGAAAEPSGAVELASVHAVIGDLDADEILLAKRADVAVPIASVTKLMTAMVVLDGRQSLDEWLPIVAWSESHGKNAYSRLRVGSKTTREQLLRIALMSSENLAAHVLARHHPGGLLAFVAAMNDKARSLGMSQSQFVDPTGLSVGNRASAADLWKMVQAAYAYEQIREWSTTQRSTVRFRSPRYTLGYGNTNPLTLGSRWAVDLSKTGYLTEAGRCLVMVADIDGRAVGMVLLNSFGTRTPLGDAGRARRWLKTGEVGKVAGAARAYERRVSAHYEQAATNH